MIDPKKLSDPAYVKGALDKGASKSQIEALVELSNSLTDATLKTDALRAEANELAKTIGQSNPDERQSKIEAASALKNEVTTAETRLSELQGRFSAAALEIPNPAHESVPIGGEGDFRVESTHGDCPPPERTHAELGEALGLVDTERAVRMSGSRFAYVMGDAVRLQFALVQWTLDKLDTHGFTPVVTPVLVREEQMEFSGFFPTDRNAVYKLDGDDLFLVGTSEVALAGLHRQEHLDADDLPLRYAGYSSCFRREAGTYGKDTSGIFRVHQFDKVEMFVYSDPDRSWDELETLRDIQQEIVGDLGLPYRVITVATGDLGAPAAKKYDLEVWLPSEQRYREITSCSNYTDFSTRRMSCYVKGGDQSNRLAHTLNGTACAIGRTLLFIFENYQTEDGFVEIPKALRSYCGDREIIEPLA